MKKKPRPTDGGGNWMDTYGDMVTLLMTFFVLLYSMSSLDQQKWEVFVRSIFPNSNEELKDQVAVNSEVGESELEGSVDVPEIEVEDMDTLYLTLAQKLSEMGVDGVSIARGDDYTFIVFENKTFFDGDSYVLTGEGESVLDVFCEVIAPAKDLLAEINIMGYTSQGTPDQPNNPRTDRKLSADRAAEVCIYIQLKDVIQPQKLVCTSYGQYRPVDTFDTAEGRARNRRVELLLIDEGADIRALNEYYSEYQSGLERTVVTGQEFLEGNAFQEAEPNPEGISTQVFQGGDAAAPDTGAGGEAAE